MNKIVLFASGSGSNVENIKNHFSNTDGVQFPMAFCNNPNAYVIDRCKLLNIPCTVFSRDDFYKTDRIIKVINDIQPDLIVLAGFLWLIPSKLVQLYPNKIINIHPALLPKFGGKGMFGMHVHQAVVDNKETESGITIHYVNEHYDEGNIIYQAKCKVLPSDTADDVANKVHALEYEHFPKIIGKLLQAM